MLNFEVQYSIVCSASISKKNNCSTTQYNVQHLWIGNSVEPTGAFQDLARHFIATQHQDTQSWPLRSSLLLASEGSAGDFTTHGSLKCTAQILWYCCSVSMQLEYGRLVFYFRISLPPGCDFIRLNCKDALYSTVLRSSSIAPLNYALRQCPILCHAASRHKPDQKQISILSLKHLETTIAWFHIFFLMSCVGASCLAPGHSTSTCISCVGSKVDTTQVLRNLVHIWLRSCILLLLLLCRGVLGLAFEEGEPGPLPHVLPHCSRFTGRRYIPFVTTNNWVIPTSVEANCYPLRAQWFGTFPLQRKWFM